ncbi:MAG: hypothetical protein OHK0045_17380 [Raineya sp.]
MEISWKFWFAATADLMQLICIIIFLVQKVHHAKAVKWIFYTFVAGFLISIIQSLDFLQKVNNLYTFHIFTPIEFVCLTLFFRDILQKSISKSFFHILIVFFLLFSLFNSIFLQEIKKFNTYSIFIEGLVMIGLSSFYFIIGVRKMETIKEFQETNHIFYIVAGIFLYFLGDFFILSLMNFIYEHADREFAKFTWILHIIFLWVYYILIGIGIWKIPKKNGSTSYLSQEFF